MRKMGWREGEGLGKNKEGNKEPILVDFKTDRKGKFLLKFILFNCDHELDTQIMNSSLLEKSLTLLSRWITY